MLLVGSRSAIKPRLRHNEKAPEANLRGQIYGLRELLAFGNLPPERYVDFSTFYWRTI